MIPLIPGLYSLIADYFGPKIRGRIYGLLQLAQPLGYLAGMILALLVAPLLEGKIFHLEGWRSIFLVTGSLGIVMAVVIFFGIKEVPRGQSEPEYEGMDDIGQVRFNWAFSQGCLEKENHVVHFPPGVRWCVSMECDHIFLLRVFDAGTRV